MSVICLICKDKLLNTAPGTPLGSLNSLVENQAIATGCGHLYHIECLQSWFRTQKKKLQNQGITGNFPDHCPTCRTEVHDNHIRRIYLLEDHRESLERAKLLEKLENLEIYSHQLEVHVQQLQRENDLLLNKALAPLSTKGKTDEFATIVNNDKVIWLKKDSQPLSGVVLTIFKKDGSLFVKIKLDKKIRTNSRSGLFGSFRFDKKQEVTIPFEEIILEKEYKKNNIVHENEMLSSSEPASPLHKMPSFRSSTLSLPGEYLNFYRPQDFRQKSSFDYIHNYGSTIELSHPISELPEDNIEQIVNSVLHPQVDETHKTIDTPIIVKDHSNNEGKHRLSLEQRDYVLFTPPLSPKLNERPNSSFESALHLQDNRTKPVTFADDLLHGRKSPINLVSGKGNHFRDHDYNNVIEMSGNLEKNGQPVTPPKTSVETDVLPAAGFEYEQEDLTVTGVQLPSKIIDSFNLPTINLVDASTPSSPSSPLSLPSVQTELQNDIFIDPSTNSPGWNYNRSCFDITFSMLFYECQVFDKLRLVGDSSGDDIQHLVRQIIGNEFIIPIRDPQTQRYLVGYSDRLHEAISHLCSKYLDLEELMTILFEYVFKISPFIAYSYDMCDYIHQFFIDFTDKQRFPTVQKLLEQSLLLQDNLKLRAEPNPALFLQMPNSENGIIIHYEAVLPSLILNIENLLEKDAIKCEAKACYCNKIASLECKTCAKIHGKSPVLFCEECSVLLEAIHDEMYHRLDIVPINAIKAPSSPLLLSGIICVKDNVYSAFIRNANVEDKAKWIFMEDFNDGSPKITELPGLDDWIESICSDSSNLNVSALDKLQRKLLTECRMLFYLPIQNSYA